MATLSKKQRQVLRWLKDHPGSVARNHIQPNGRKCFRLMTADQSPFMNVQKRVIYQLKEKGFIHAVGPFEFEAPNVQKV